MTEARNGHTATLLDDGTVLVVGGAREQRTHLASVERFDPKAGTWKTEKPLGTPRWLHAAVHLGDDSVVVVGGRSNASQGGQGPGVSLDAVERFEPKTGAWTKVASMSEERQRAGIAVLSDGRTVVAVGGQTATSSTNYAETWTPGAEAWAPLENHLSMSLASHSATRLPSGDLLVVGGEPPNAVDTARVQRWVAATKQWCLAGELATSRKLHSASLLADGSVLVVGGTSSGVPEKSAERWYDAKGRCEEPPGVALGW
jgi:N-acetylneuraminic acid mutarotase